ncbi:pentatricopeptide repeat-containing protein At4g13650 [Cucurbita pepo subsp. pepo]|uniref:pentatricopeptide repeat-containing protein At4g13650 n=1 Tax=Cucurbita pepo subsp. pepo TaxID=3664 RepID=UPI000C9D85CC|nr:pentatricopeptide repeat-containing protein At4g13650 [Cucurbita pepo subsp. pepo]XP_023517272.1 pentatricopeptide repeat-containing protein At4g13650 [Cucurbita pepo subsp. pepo]XP_023517273.1 pentatricopeptide repeat-containing protein At4g13650 [Cucurbita pepo subsp. pepo]
MAAASVWVRPTSSFRPSFPTSKYIDWVSKSYNLVRVNAVGATNSHAFDEFSLHMEQAKSKSIQLMNFMEQRGIRANYQTYLWLLDGCLNFGSLLETSRLHCRILKSGFAVEPLLIDSLLDNYLRHGDLNGAQKVFDDNPNRTVFSWNKMIHGLVAQKLNSQVFGLFRRMLAEKITPNENTFSGILKACVGCNIAFNYVEQVHSRIIYYGFDSNSLVANLLIDLYSKNGFIESAKKVFNDIYMKDIVTWVAMISGLSQNGLEEEAILLFCDMHASEIFPTPYVLSSVLSASTKKKLFKLGEQLHCLVIKWGFHSETYVCNALVSLYSRSGKLISAERIFSTMQFRDGVSYNSLISGLVQQGYSDKALELFHKMQRDCMKLDCITVASLLSACASIGALHKGMQLHSYALKAGMSADIILEGSLLDLYSKCADVETARKFFLTTETENIVLWNVMLVAYGQLDNLSDSFKIFRQMQIEGMIPNQFTYPSILKTCTSLGALDLGEQIHTLVIKTGFWLNAYVCSVLIDMYAKHGKLELAHGILRRLPEDDVVSWTAMIAGYVQHDMFSEALKLFNEMEYLGIVSDNIGFSSAISACAGVRALRQGQQIHAQAYVSGFGDDLSINNALISLYARCGRIQEAYLAFEKMDDKNNISWNSLVSGFEQSGYFEEALQVFVQMLRSEVEVNLFTYGSAISAAASLANIKQGQQIHAMILKTAYDSEMEASNSLITFYAKCGSIDDAWREFNDMSEKNVISWNAMITGYSQHGFGTETLCLFEEMKNCGVVPNHVTFVGVLSSCSHVGLVNEGLEYFESMSKVHGLVPKSEHYVCIVDLLGRAGLLNRAIDFIEAMPIPADAMIWRTLLSACVIHKNMEIGERAARHLLELEPEDSATYVLLSNIYAVSRKWIHRDWSRKLMKDRGVKKEPGRSWIEVKNAVHAFYAGDKLHPLTNQIYEYIEHLNTRTSELGYVQDSFSLLNDTEEGKKDPTMNVHSEKLAIAYGLLNLGNNIPIRVMKNLRVCNDCHNWIKYVSKVSDRLIIVRDAHRFHHFDGGVCSCRDFW